MKYIYIITGICTLFTSSAMHLRRRRGNQNQRRGEREREVGKWTEGEIERQGKERVDLLIEGSSVHACMQSGCVLCFWGAQLLAHGLVLMYIVYFKAFISSDVIGGRGPSLEYRGMTCMT